MKKKIISIFASLLFISTVVGQHSIVLTNPLGNDRTDEMVEVNALKLKTNFKSKSYILKNDKNEEIAYQLCYNNKKKVQSLIFQATVKANSSTTYTLTIGKPAPVKPKTVARFVPERKDDLAWENDLAAYRMYGPALAKENPSNGSDLWLKRTDELIVDKFYHDELKNGLSYHVDHGQGLDCYSVGHTLGAGGIAPFALDSLWIGNHYDSYKIIENGPLRSVFSLIYDSVKVGTQFYKQTITITSNAGSILNKAVLKFTGSPQKMELAAGIFLHDGKGQLQQNTANGTEAYAEDATSIANVPSGRNYVGVFVPVQINKAIRKDKHGLLLTNYLVGNTFTYYFGGGWSKWHFPSDESWFIAVNQFAECIKNPLKISIR